jgi:hypothetical protein
MAIGMVITTVVRVSVIVTTTLNLALWAFRPNSYANGPRARRWTGTYTVVWAIFLPVCGAVALAFGGTWQGVVTGAVALACWPVTILALRRRSVSRAAHQEAGRQTNEQLVALLDERGRAEVDDLLASGKSVRAVRRVRELTGLPLIDAKRLADSLKR